MHVRIDLADPTPSFEQLRRQIIGLIESGQLRSDERLPAIRQLAADLGLSAGTVARTYRDLEQAGWVRSRRGGGTRVCARLAPPVAAVTSLREEVARARKVGISAAAVRSAVEQELRLGPE